MEWQYWYDPRVEDVLLPGESMTYEEYLDALCRVVYTDFETVSDRYLTNGHQV
jgi:hypothetical protein